MKAVLIVFISLVCLPATAEEKTCTVKGMDCAGCADTIKEKVCNDGYTTCEVTLKDEKAKTGQIHIVTKEKTAKVDPKMLTDLIKDTTYTVETCTAGAPKPVAAKKKKTT